MTNYYESLDMALNQLRFMYLKAYSTGDYVQASAHLFNRNCACPPEAQDPSMKPFSIIGHGLRAMLTENLQAKNYCDYWSPIIEINMAKFRKDNQSQWGTM